MCDYSAEAAESRKAGVGDKLVVAMISEHTKGLVSNHEPNIAVCLIPGTRLIISTPHATAESSTPAAIIEYASPAACWDDPHWVSIVVAATSSGSPEANQAPRVTLKVCMPT